MQRRLAPTHNECAFLLRGGHSPRYCPVRLAGQGPAGSQSDSELGTCEPNGRFSHRSDAVHCVRLHATTCPQAAAGMETSRKVGSKDCSSALASTDGQRVPVGDGVPIDHWSPHCSVREGRGQVTRHGRTHRSISPIRQTRYSRWNLILLHRA